MRVFRKSRIQSFCVVISMLGEWLRLDFLDLYRPRRRAIAHITSSKSLQHLPGEISRIVYVHIPSKLLRFLLGFCLDFKCDMACDWYDYVVCHGVCVCGN